MIRRKDFVDFKTEQDLIRSHSFDFEIPADLISTSGPAAGTAIVPLGFWWKAPKRFSYIDFEDESGRSFPLPTSAYNTELTLRVMLEYARRLLEYNSISELPTEVWSPLTKIVAGDPPLALSEVRQQWRDSTTPPISHLAQHADFISLLEVCALASLLAVPLHSDLNRRRIIKLKYEERQSTYFRTDKYIIPASNRKRIWRWIGRRFRRFFGLGTYKFDLGNAFIRSQSYHFEAQAPPGLKFTKVSLKRANKPPTVTSGRLQDKIHLHELDLGHDWIATVRSKLIVTDGWLTSAIICTVIAGGVLIGITSNIQGLDPAASQSMIAVTLLVPSVAMSIVWRRVHRLVERLHKGLRYMFLSLAVLLFYLALRVAEGPMMTQSSHGTPDTATSRLIDGSELALISSVVLGWTILVLLILMAARFPAARLRDLWLALRERQ